VPILTAFADASRALLAEAPAARVHFMDGPYSVELSREAEAWIVRLSDGVHRDRSRQDALVDPAVLVESVLAASVAVLRACAARRQADRDTRALADAARALGVAWRG
jgi:hypothetical protein